MTKTKKQLRAEAVERLMNLENSGMSYTPSDVLEKVTPFPNANMETLIDLLTDDEQPEEAEHDSRGKLEERAGELATGFAESNYGYVALYDGIIALLDRQAAITERECREHEDELLLRISTKMVMDR